jgi:hypothetical protein
MKRRILYPDEVPERTILPLVALAAAEYGVEDPQDLFTGTHLHRTVRARHTAWVILRDEERWGPTQIARSFGRTHGSASAALKHADAWQKYDPEAYRKLESVRRAYCAIRKAQFGAQLDQLVEGYREALASYEAAVETYKSDIEREMERYRVARLSVAASARFERGESVSVELDLSHVPPGLYKMGIDGGAGTDWTAQQTIDRAQHEVMLTQSGAAAAKTGDAP